MDSLTQIVLGASVAAVVAPASRRRTAMLLGAVAGTLPDLDVFILNALAVDDLAHFTWHRGPSHALVVLALLGVGIALLLHRLWPAWRTAPWRWFAALQLALLTHPLLDAFTTYGTQLFWPLPVAPAMISSIFIIDPLYTLPLLVGCVVALIGRERRIAQTALVAGLALSSAYLGWSLVAKALVDRAAATALAEQGLGAAPRFSVPMPFNTLLWRVVAMTPDGFVEGERSLVADRGTMRFRHLPSDRAALAAVAGDPAVQRLQWFSHGFLKAEVREGQLVLSDLRMGMEPDFTFRFIVAHQDGDHWQAIAPVQVEWPWQARERLAGLWPRIWTEPPTP